MLALRLNANDNFYLYTVDIATGDLTELRTYSLGGTGSWNGCGMTKFGDLILLGVLDQNNPPTFHLYDLNLDDGSLNERGQGYAIGPSAGWWGCGLGTDGDTLFVGLVENASGNFGLYSGDSIDTMPLSADLTLTLEISPMATPTPQLARPTGLSLTEASGDITAEWNGVTDATGYVLEWREEGSGDVWQTVDVTTPPHTFTP